MKIWSREGYQLGAFGLVLLAIIFSIVARSGAESASDRSRRDAWGLAYDIPLPPDTFFEGAGVGGSRLTFAPLRRHVSASFAAGVLTYYEDGFESEGWELSDKEVADDGAWTAAWIKDERTVRLNFGRMQLNSKRATMELAQCPPLVPGHCGPGHLYPMPTPNRR